MEKDDNIESMLEFEHDTHLLLDLIYEKYNHDFRRYAMSSIQRRLKSALVRYEMKSLTEVRRKVETDAEFFLPLLQFLTVPTSEMFRDPGFFLTLRTKVIPVLKTYPSLKIWIAGCSTGEEVYSYAILLHEEGLLERTTIYATDINPTSLQKAEQGFFSLDRMKDFTVNYQKGGGTETFANYFTIAYDSAMVNKELKKNVVFADHSLATDSVFSEMQLVSCRNVLIYFNRDLQDRALGLFYDSLCYRGFLCVGSKESLRFSKYNSYFDETYKLDKIYQRK